MLDILWRIKITSYKAFKPTDKVIAIKAAPTQVPIQTKINNLYEYLMLRGNLIILDRTNTGSGVNPDIYEVPKDYVFFLVSANMSVGMNTTFPGSQCWYSYLRYQPSGAGTAILAVRYINLDNAWSTHVVNAQLTPTIPLAFAAGSNFYVYQQSSTITTEVCIQGYLIKSNEIPQFLA